MYDIKIGRFDQDPSAQGVVRPSDDSWQLVIDKDGYPHLYVKVRFDASMPDEAKTGFLCVEDVLPDGMSIPELMQGSFGGPLSPEDEEKAIAEYEASRARTGIPCPR